MAEQGNEDKALQITTLTAAVAEARAREAAMEAKLRADEAVRRRLHNTILELKGNIRVFCRVRPALRTGPFHRLRHTLIEHTHIRTVSLSHSLLHILLSCAAAESVGEMPLRLFTEGDAADRSIEVLQHAVRTASRSYTRSIEHGLPRHTDPPRPGATYREC
jgi:hypothetical protein